MSGQISSDQVMLAGHRFWKFQCDKLPDFAKRITNVDMGSWSAEPAKVDHGSSQWQEWAPGAIHYDDIVCTAHVDPKTGPAMKMTIDQGLGAQGSAFRFPVTIQFTDSKGTVLLTYNYHDCTIVSWTTTGHDAHNHSESKKESLTLRPMWAEAQ